MNPLITPVRRRLAGALAVSVLALAACGSDADDTTTTDPAVTTVSPTAPSDTTAATDGTTATDAPTDSSPTDDADASGDVPERIVSLSPTHTEILFAIGAGDQVVAIDDYSNYPPEALELPHDLSGFEPNVEAIAGFEPDLVVVGGDFTGLGDQLAAIDIEMWDGPAAMTLDDTYAQIEELGDITGHDEEAAELVESMQSEIDEIIASTPLSEVPITYYHELGTDLYSVDSTTFIGELYTLLGLRNIADAAEGDHGGYPQLNAEFIISADPDLIFLADTICCAESAATVAARPGWESMTAVVDGNVIEMDDDIASRWGPRVVDYLAAVSAAIQAL